MAATIFVAMLSLFFLNQTVAQEIGIGAAGMYNFQTSGWGAGVRVPIHPQEQVTWTPQLAYYFPFNKVNETIIGLGLEYKFLRMPNTDYYSILHVGYDNWANASQSALKGATIANWDCELGMGLAGRNCLKPFVEYRYNLRFLETHLQVGFIYIFGCGGSTIDRCPAYQ